MDHISYLVHRLKKPNSRVRKDACEQLSREPKLPGKAILALNQAAHDPDPHVAEAARRALSVHEQNNVTSPFRDQFTSHSPRSDYPWSWIGNVHPAHFLFLFMGLFMIFVSHDWRISLFILLFLAGCILVTGLAEQSNHKKLVEVWSELARQTGLRVDPGHLYFFGQSIPPSINGIYRGRRISIKKQVQHMSGYDGDIPVVYTCTELQVKNTGNYLFSMGSKSWSERLFKHSSASSGNASFDEQFSFMGKPPEFMQRACTLIVSHPILLERPDEVIMLTDYPLSWVSWSRPKIELNAHELVCLQSGISTDVPGEVEILNLLCDLAELAEDMERIESNL